MATIRRLSLSSSRIARLTTLLSIAVLGLLAVAACGSDSSAAQQSTPRPTATLSSSAAVDSACGAFEAVGMPTPVTVAGIETLFAQGRFSRTEPPGDAGQIALFFRDAISDGLGKDAPIGCYWALNLTTDGTLGTRAFWVAVNLPGTLSADQAQDVYDELASRGATMVGLSSFDLRGETASRVLIADIPVGQAKTIGGTLIMAGKYAVVQIASADLPIGSVSPTVPTATVGAVRTPYVTPVAGSQPFGQWFESELEAELGVGLDLTSVIQAATNGKTSLVMSLVVTDGNTNIDNAGGKFASIVNAADGRITSSINEPSIAIINFEEMVANGTTGSGSFSFVQGQDTILLTFQY